MNFFKNMMAKQMMKRQMKDVPPEQQEKMLKALEENPELFENMGKEIQEEMAKGTDQMQAAMMVATKYQEELKKVLGSSN